MKKVVVLDEHREGRESLARILRRKGFAVVQAGDADTALASVSSPVPPDLVIAGVTDRDRSEFLSDLRTLSPALPVLFLSDYCAPESRLRSAVHGSFLMSRSLLFYINTRPVALSELDRMIRIILQRTGGPYERPLAA
jgi:DNA-binding response OmpR family regulator